MTRSPYDPFVEPPLTLGGRARRRLRRAIEPLAVHLVDWCRSLDRRVGGVEDRVGTVEARAESLLESAHSADRALGDAGIRTGRVEGRVAEVEGRVGEVEGRVGEVEGRVGQVEGRVGQVEGRVEGLADGLVEIKVESRLETLEGRADRAYWGREALVERLNAADARHDGLALSVAVLEERAEAAFWGREALVDRLNTAEVREDALVEAFALMKHRVDEHVPMPLAIAMDAMAMGRRLAALEDQVELLTRQLAESRGGEAGATLVAFPPSPDHRERAVG